MRWPTPQDYNEAIQNPSTNFADEELRTGSVELDVLGLPRPITGAFASVYKLNCPERSVAVRCFLRKVPDQQERYRKISDFILNDTLPYTVDFEFIDKGIRVGSSWFPILKMAWVDGLLLPQYIEKHLQNPKKLSKLERSFARMLFELKRDGIAHGDLQHGNIMLVGDEMRLVDYDGMFVPDLHLFDSLELGHRNYQHPERSERDFGDYLDHFSAWVISTSLNALLIDPDLWQELNGGDECLLFRATDFQDPVTSRAFALLENHHSQTIQVRTRHLRSLLNLVPEEVPLLSDEIDSLPVLQPLPAWDSCPQWVRSQLSTMDNDQIRLKVKSPESPSLPAIVSNSSTIKDPVTTSGSPAIPGEQPSSQERTLIIVVALLFFVAPVIFLVYDTMAKIGLGSLFMAALLAVGMLVFGNFHAVIRKHLLKLFH